MEHLDLDGRSSTGAPANMPPEEVGRDPVATKDPVAERLIRTTLDEMIQRRGLERATMAPEEIAPIENEAILAVYSVMNAIVRAGWRIHRDHPVCGECGEKVNIRARSARAWRETEGVAIASAMKAQAEADRLRETNE